MSGRASTKLEKRHKQAVYRQRIVSYLKQIHTVPVNEEELRRLFCWLLSDMTLPKRHMRKVFDALVERAPRVAGELIHNELARTKTERFSLDEYCAWFDAMSEQYNGSHYWIRKCVETLSMQKVTVPEEKIVRWAMNALQKRNYKDGGCLILIGRCTGSHFIKKSEVHWHTQDAAAQQYDHGITRLFAILLTWLTPKKHGQLSVRKARAIADIVHIAFTERKGDDGEFTSQFLLRMASETLTSKAFTLVLSEYRTMLRETQKEQRCAMSKALKFGNTLQSH